jgi:hypothetical protein
VKKNMRGQISVFIVLGLIILVLTGLSLYIYDQNTSNLKHQYENQYLVHLSVEPVKRYVENCIDLVSQKPIIDIGKYGGTLNPNKYQYYLNKKYNYLCYDEEGICVQKPLLRQDIEKELELSIYNNLSKCIDLTVFERQGFVISSGEMDIDVKIGREDVIIKLKYPLNLIKENVSLVIEDYQVKILEPLGLLYETSIEIVNSQNTNGNFDIVEYMINNGNKILIEKHRKYPDILYSLSMKDYKFNFALEGYNVVSNPFFSIDTENDGCCYNLYDKTCFKNIVMEECNKNGGIFDYNSNCICPEAENTNLITCPDGNCDSCDKTYNYVTQKFDNEQMNHGESWCVYDSYAGKGYDYVGTRHYVHYCIDGKEYVEECQDYREELCTEEKVLWNDELLNKAGCRINRWQDCNDCQTKECCENIDYRDCHWKDWLTTKGQCVAYVPPGLKFWESGNEVCTKATEVKECDGFSCPNIWVDDTAMYCYMQGDCGNYRNINDEISYGGFYNSDPTDKVQPYVYLDGGLTKKGDDYSINLGINNSDVQTLYQEYNFEFNDEFIQLISIGMNYIDKVSSLSLSDFLNPFSDLDITILDIAICDTFKPPWGGDKCQLCNMNDSFRQCTEYECKSLGKECMYEELNGYPKCSVRDINDNIKPKIEFNYISQGYFAEKTELQVHTKNYQGYEISPIIKPYSLVTFGINTSEETVCHLNILPRLKYLQAPSYYFGDSKFSKYHNLTLRIPNRLLLPKKTLDFLNISKISEIVGFLEQPKQLLNIYKTKYKTQIEFYDSITGDNVVSKIEPYVNNMLKFVNEFSSLLPFYKKIILTLLDGFENGTYYFFIECKDRAGNENSEELFITFSIENKSHDVYPPILLGFNPENNSVIKNSESSKIQVYLNEPSNCKYDLIDRDYELMDYEFDCKNSMYEMNPKFSGSFECFDTINITNENLIYIRCKDNPDEIKNYLFKIALTKEEGINGEVNSKYLNVINNSIFATSKMLNENLIFKVKKKDINIKLHIDDFMNCQYTYENISYDFDDCNKTNNIELGFYECNTNIILNANSSENLKINKSFQLNLLESNGMNLIDNFQIIDNKLKINYTSQDIIKINIPDKNINFELKIDKNYKCIDRNLNSDEKFEMTCFNSGDSTYCYTILYSNNSYDITCVPKNHLNLNNLQNIEVECKKPNDVVKNVNSKSYEFIIHKSPEFEIIGLGPVGEIDTLRPTLSVQTNHQASCGYYKDFVYGTILMNNVNGIQHEADIEVEEGSHKYYIYCKDQYGNELENTIKFVVI